MAIYSLNTNNINRQSGRSSVAAAAYRAGDTLINEQDNTTHDYSKKKVAHSEIMLPDGAPQWAKERQKLWNEVERSEKRKDARTAREVRVALPNEFTREQNIELCQRLGSLFTQQGMVVDFAIHENKGNIHAHFLLSTRELTPDGFAKKKNRHWNTDEFLTEIRSAWADLINTHLLKNGFDQVVSDKSYAERGIEKIPTIHEGYAARAIEKQGGTSQRCLANRKIKEYNQQKGLDDIPIRDKKVQLLFQYEQNTRNLSKLEKFYQQIETIMQRVNPTDGIYALRTQRDALNKVWQSLFDEDSFRKDIKRTHPTMSPNQVEQTLNLIGIQRVPHYQLARDLYMEAKEHIIAQVPKANKVQSKTKNFSR